MEKRKVIEVRALRDCRGRLHRVSQTCDRQESAPKKVQHLWDPGLVPQPSVAMEQIWNYIIAHWKED